MIEPIQGLPDSVVGFEAIGSVTARDYEEVVAPAVEDALARHETIRLIHVLGGRLEHTTPGALWEDSKLALHVQAFERIAVVTDLKSVRALVHGGGWIVPGDLRLFSTAARAEAEAWAVAGLADGSPENQKGDEKDG